MKISLYLLGFATCFLSCKNDDDDNTTITPARDRTEQQITDKALLLDYLNTHYYNAADFDGTNPDPKSADIKITALEEDTEVPEGHRLLIDDVITKEVTYASTKYEVYYIDLNKNVDPTSASPHFSDNVVMNYKGFTLEGLSFDESVNGTFNIDLMSLIPGWRKVVPEFHVAENVSDGSDGTINFVNHGVGIMFLPSGLAYFNIAKPDFPSYSCLVFSFDLLHMFENDHDGDNVPSYKEDLTGDGEFAYNSSTSARDGDDTDGDGAPNYVDVDDDGDGVNTIYEDIDGDGDPTNDIGKNGIPKYLDPEETEANYDVYTES